MRLKFSSYLRQGAANRDREAAGEDTTSRGAGSYANGGGYERVDEPGLKWEIARVVLIVCAVLACVLGGAYYIGLKMEGVATALLEEETDGKAPYLGAADA